MRHSAVSAEAPILGYLPQFFDWDIPFALARSLRGGGATNHGIEVGVAEAFWLWRWLPDRDSRRGCTRIGTQCGNSELKRFFRRINPGNTSSPFTVWSASSAEYLAGF